MSLLYYYITLGLWFNIQLLMCCSIFAYRFPRRNRFALRLTLSLLLYFAASIGGSALFLLNTSPDSDAWFTLFSALQFVYFFFVWCLLLCGLVFCFSIGRKEAVFIGIGCYAAQHIAYSLSFLAQNILPGLPESYGVTVLFETVPTVLVCLAVWLLLTRKGPLRMRRREMRFLPLAGVMAASCILLSSFSANLFIQEDVVAAMLIEKGYAVICCALILLLLFGFTRENELENDKQTTELLLHAEQEQHRLNRETIDIINIKCHDLKHQISVLREMDKKPERDEAIAEIEQAVQFYDSNIHTGNGTLDLVLTQKSFFCYHKGIALECLADGACIDFMKPADLLSLFGNILDNAIEAVQAFPQEKRVISLRIGERGGTVFVYAENPCGELSFTDGLPQTTKEDKAYHGFGVRSIRYIVKKYGGDVRMYAEEGKFHADILFYASARRAAPHQGD